MAKLDENGRCCGRKPLVYKRPPLLFCSRCDRQFDPESGEQMENWAYRRIGQEFVRNSGQAWARERKG